MNQARIFKELLSPRLLRLAELAPPGKVLADIGTDHAYLPSYLVKNQLIPRAIASDIHAGPIEAARKQVRDALLEDQIQVRMGDGLATIAPGEVSALVVAGMGAGTIQGILAKGETVLQGVTHLVLQPLEGAAGLRRWLGKKGWTLVQEDLVAEGHRIYECMLWTRTEEDTAAYPLPHAQWDETNWRILNTGEFSTFGGQAFSEGALSLLGPLLVYKRNSLLTKVINRLLEREQNAIIGMRRARQPENERIAQREEAMAEWEAIKQWLSQ